uniref:Uncharacterized protein n=1 Tax=Oryza barthii TaxID=65489 RepID=A0A0D3FFS7_9ORYZ
MGALFRFERSMTGGVHRKRDGHGPTKQRLNASEYLPSSPGRNTRKSRIFLPFSSPHRRHREPPRPPDRGAARPPTSEGSRPTRTVAQGVDSKSRPGG